MSGQVRLT